MNARLPQVKIEAREVFGAGADIAGLLLDERFDLALAPMTSCPHGFGSRTVRREPLRIALSQADPLARRTRIELATLADRLPRPRRRHRPDGGLRAEARRTGRRQRGLGNLADGHGEALINASLAQQLPRGVALVELARPTAPPSYDAVWLQDEQPRIQRSLAVAAELATEQGWL
jgi:DNA-binding transcriptional LysR family regulator